MMVIESASYVVRRLQMEKIGRNPNGGCRPKLMMQRLTLERKPAAELPESRFMRSGGGAEASVRNVHVDVGVVRPVEQVEELKPELEVDAFGEMKILVDVGIRLKEIRLPELHRLLVALA